MVAAKWERVEDDSVGDVTERLVVPGGWLYRTYLTEPTGGDDALNIAIALTFVPYPASWNRSS